MLAAGALRRDIIMGFMTSLLAQDEAASVRQAAVDLLGAHLAAEPGLAATYFDTLVSASRDASTSVRKAAMRTLWEACIKPPGFARAAEACCAVLHRGADPEESIQELVAQVFQGLWFASTARGALSHPCLLSSAVHSLEEDVNLLDLWFRVVLYPHGEQIKIYSWEGPHTNSWSPHPLLKPGLKHVDFVLALKAYSEYSPHTGGAQRSAAERAAQLAAVAAAAYEAGGPTIHLPLDASHALIVVMRKARVASHVGRSCMSVGVELLQCPMRAYHGCANAGVAWTVTWDDYDVPVTITHCRRWSARVASSRSRSWRRGARWRLRCWRACCAPARPAATSAALSAPPSPTSSCGALP